MIAVPGGAQIWVACGATDLRRGFTYTLMYLAAAIWLISLLAVVYWANRISRPIQRLTTALSEVAAGNLEHRVEAGRNDEVGSAIAAFNHMAAQLQDSSPDFIRARLHPINDRGQRNAIREQLVGIDIHLVLTHEPTDARYFGHSGNGR